MKRRTNLFYINTDETNFLTFSNYTEHLTGDFLATNFKLFPSRFLCMYIPKLMDIARVGDTVEPDKLDKVEKQKRLIQNRDNFIKHYLVSYYENKLAMMRDKIVNDMKDELNISHPDELMHYLGYLIDCIMRYDANTKIQYISTITEQDYNGTFTDIICNIDSSAAFDKLFGIEENENYNNQDIVEATGLDKEFLYGWASETIDGEYKPYFGPSDYRSVQPIFDADNNYYFDSKYARITRTTKPAVVPVTEDEKENQKYKQEEIQFNVIIPLYDIVCMDKEMNDTRILDADNSQYLDGWDKEEANTLYLNKNLVNGDYVQNVPYGIWFANDVVTLQKDTYTRYAPSWSLMISTQFKPFPNSKHLFMDGNSGGTDKAYPTFAQILYNQATIYEQYERAMETIQEMREQMTSYINYIKEVTNNVAILQNSTSIQNLIQEIVRNEVRNIYMGGSGGGTTIQANKHQWEWRGDTI